MELLNRRNYTFADCSNTFFQFNSLYIFSWLLLIVEPQLFNVYIQHIADKRLGLRISNDAYPFLLNPSTN